MATDWRINSTSFFDDNALKSELKAAKGKNHSVQRGENKGSKIFNFQIIFSPKSLTSDAAVISFSNYQLAFSFSCFRLDFFRIEKKFHPANAVKVKFQIVLVSKTLWKCNNSLAFIASKAVGCNKKMKKYETTLCHRIENSGKK